MTGRMPLGDFGVGGVVQVRKGEDVSEGDVWLVEMPRIQVKVRVW